MSGVDRKFRPEGHDALRVIPNSDPQGRKFLSAPNTHVSYISISNALSYPLSAQRTLWSDRADARADLSLRWAHSHFAGFVMRRFILKFDVIVTSQWRQPNDKVTRRPVQSTHKVSVFFFLSNLSEITWAR